MQTTTFLTLALSPLLALAAENPITLPTADTTLVAGKPTEITWQPTTKGDITLQLKKGDNDNLQDVLTIATGELNDGAYTWAIPGDLPPGKDYAIAITDAAGEVNYTPLITIKKPLTKVADAPATSAGPDAEKMRLMADIPSSSFSAPASSPNPVQSAADVPTTVPTMAALASATPSAAGVPPHTFRAPILPRGHESNETLTGVKPVGTATGEMPLSTGAAGINGTTKGNGTYTGGRNKGNGTTLYAPKKGEEEKEEEEEEDAAVGVRGSVLAVIVGVVGAGMFLA